MANKPQPSNEKNPTEVEADRLHRMSNQFEIGKQIYAAHSLLLRLPSSSQAKVFSFLERASIAFEAAGGTIRQGVDSLGQNGPVLRYETGDILPYDIGRLLAEDYSFTQNFI